MTRSRRRSRLGRRRDGLDLERARGVVDELVQVELDLEVVGARVVIVLVVVVGAHALDLDPDVERLDGLPVTCPHQLEIADETADGRGGQALCPRLVADLVLERRHVGDQVWLARLVDRVDGEPPVAAARRS